ncbi:MAG: hypothetical protein ACI8PZ_004704 [Myxococcota bacterium]|jgi:hypothetical protein
MRLSWLALPLLLVACGKDSKDGQDSAAAGTTDGPKTVTEGDVRCEVTQSEVIPSVFTVTWAGLEGDARVEYGEGEAFDKSTPASGGSDHAIPVLGLAAGDTVRLRGVTETADGPVVCDTIEVEVPYPPAALKEFTLQVPATGASELAAEDGFVMTTLIQEDTAWTVIMNLEGDYVWWYPTPDDAIVVTSLPSLDGAAVQWGEYDREKERDIGVVRRIRLDGTDETVTRTYLGHHGFIEHPDGTMGWLALEFRDVDVDAGPGETIMRLATDRIMEAPIGSSYDNDTEPATLFNMFDDSGMFPAVNCGHQASDFDRYGEFDIHEWTHSNSFTYVPDDDSYYIYSKYTDTLIKVTRPATPGGQGEFKWQMSGMDGDFTHPDGSPVWRGAEDSDLWSHGHMSHVWPGGFALFNNGDHNAEVVSSIAEYAFDETAMTVEKVYEFRHPEGKHTPAMGDVRKLPGGNYLAGWSTLGTINEVDPDTDSVVWELQGDLGVITGRMYAIPDIYNTAAW